MRVCKLAADLQMVSCLAALWLSPRLASLRAQGHTSHVNKQRAMRPCCGPQVTLQSNLDQSTLTVLIYLQPSAFAVAKSAHGNRETQHCSDQNVCSDLSAKGSTLKFATWQTAHTARHVREKCCWVRRGYMVADVLRSKVAHNFDPEMSD